MKHMKEIQKATFVFRGRDERETRKRKGQMSCQYKKINLKIN